jgi:hypothetical protein
VNEYHLCLNPTHWWSINFVLRVVKNETLRQKRWSQIQIDLLHSLTYTSKLTVRSVKNETLRQKRWFQFSHCKFSIYKHYSSSTCSWSIYIYPAINTFAVQICYAKIIKYVVILEFDVQTVLSYLTISVFSKDCGVWLPRTFLL